MGGRDPYVHRHRTDTKETAHGRRNGAGLLRRGSGHSALLSAGGVAAVSAEVSGLRKNDDRVAYLNSLGWTVAVEPAKTEELLIPETFDGGYADYLALQQEQGFDLTQYCGRRVKRYTYTVTNYPDRKDVSAVLLIYKNRIVGGQIQSADGTILHGLAVPNEKA